MEENTNNEAPVEAVEEVAAPEEAAAPEVESSAEIASDINQPVFALQVTWNENSTEEDKEEANRFVKETFEVLKNMTEIPGAIGSITIIRS